MKFSGMYKIINKVNGKYYVGCSADIDSPNTGRWYRHKQRLKTNTHPNKHLQSSWNKYGEENFVLIICESCTVDELIKTEQKYLNIAKGESVNVYNSSFIAGRVEMTLEIRAKLRKNCPRRCGKDNYFYGKSFSGKLNAQYNYTIYRFLNEKTKEEFIGTRFDFCRKFNFSRTVGYDLTREQPKKRRDGWTAI